MYVYATMHVVIGYSITLFNVAVTLFTIGVTYGGKTPSGKRRERPSSQRYTRLIDELPMELSSSSTADLKKEEKQIHYSRSRNENYLRRRTNVKKPTTVSETEGDLFDVSSQSSSDETLLTYPIDEIIENEEYAYRDTLSLAGQIQYDMGHHIDVDEDWWEEES